MAEKLPNPFESRGAAKGPETEDFIAFSSNSTPGDRFVPKRGKKNRQDNWRRFGNFENQQQQNYYSPRGRGGMGYPGSSEYFSQNLREIQCHFAHFLSDYHSTPNWSHQNPFRGQHWNLGGTPRGGRGGNRGFTPRGNFRGRGGHQNDQNRSYFHPSMLEDPWANLVKKNDLNESIASEEHNQSLSDSLRPQFGDSMINPAPDVPENLDDTNDLSKYSYTSDQGLDESRLNLNEESISEENDQNDTLEGKPNLSDSMIPLVGESILERNEEDI